MFVNSSAGLSASPMWSAYAASKFGLRGFADSLRAEEIEHGVRVTTVFPSRTATPMQEKVHEQEGRTYDPSKWIDPAVVADTILHVLDLPDGVTIPEVTVRPWSHDREPDERPAIRPHRNIRLVRNTRNVKNGCQNSMSSPPSAGLSRHQSSPATPKDPP